MLLLQLVKMSLNEYMHPRNIYRTRIDFKELALNYKDFRDHAKQDLSGKVHIDFKDPETLRVLTKTLLKKDFELDVVIPRDRLVPTLPLRLNYILWIEDLLCSLPATETVVREEQGILGLDVGTGATCIYPLLGCRKNGWSFVATDNDDDAVAFAKQNVIANDFQDKITVIKAAEGSILSDVVNGCNRQIDFSMCNPPFYGNVSEADWASSKHRTNSRAPPRAVNSACSAEAVTEGGEATFVANIVKESLELGNRVRVYTTMFGKKQSATLVKNMIGNITEDHGRACNFATTEFCQGRTMRWGIAWTFLPDARLGRAAPTRKQKNVKARPIEFVVPKLPRDCGHSISAVFEKVENELADLKISFMELKKNQTHAALKFTAYCNTWTHQRRKRRALKKQEPATGKAMADYSPSTDGDSPAPKRIHMSAEEGLGSPQSRENAIECPQADCSTANEGNAIKGSNGIDVPAAAQENQNGGWMSSEPLVESLLFLRKVSENIILELHWICGILGKDGAHQILQYLKNKLS